MQRDSGGEQKVLLVILAGDEAKGELPEPQRELCDGLPRDAVPRGRPWARNTLAEWPGGR